MQEPVTAHNRTDIRQYYEYHGILMYKGNGDDMQSTYEECTDFGVSYFLLEEHLTVYYTVLEFYEDRRRAA